MYNSAHEYCYGYDKNKAPKLGLIALTAFLEPRWNYQKLSDGTKTHVWRV